MEELNELEKWLKEEIKKIDKTNDSCTEEFKLINLGQKSGYSMVIDFIREKRCNCLYGLTKQAQDLDMGY